LEGGEEKSGWIYRRELPQHEKTAVSTFLPRDGSSAVRAAWDGYVRSMEGELDAETDEEVGMEGHTEDVHSITSKLN